MEFLRENIANIDLHELIKEKNLFERFAFLVWGILMYSLAYTICFIPNDIVIGGTSGLAQIVNHYTNINIVLLVFIFSLIIQILGFIFLGVKEGLKKLKEAGFYIGVVTNKIQPLTEKVLSILNISEYLDFIHGAESGFPLKPAPDSILVMIKKAEVMKENTFMIGDGMTDIKTGKNAGVKICLVTYGYNTPQGVDVDMRADSFEELTEKFISLWK